MDPVTIGVLAVMGLFLLSCPLAHKLKKKVNESDKFEQETKDKVSKGVDYYTGNNKKDD